MLELLQSVVTAVDRPIKTSLEVLEVVHLLPESLGMKKLLRIFVEDPIDVRNSRVDRIGQSCRAIGFRRMLLARILGRLPASGVRCGAALFVLAARTFDKQGY